MSDAEISALRAKLAARPRSDDYRQRRKDIDARGLAYGLAADIEAEPVTANGVRAEWTAAPKDARDAALMYLHGGGYVIGSLDSHRHLVLRPAGPAGLRRWRWIIGWRPNTRFRRRSTIRSPATGFCWRAASCRSVSRSPVTAPGADSWLQRCWRSAMPAYHSPVVAGASRPGWTWKPLARR